ncbi:MAG: restriction endonuclease subunit S [Burkholderiales bacterium]
MSVTVALSEVADLVRGVSFPKEAKSYEMRSEYLACLRTTNVQKTVEWGDLWYVPKIHVKREEQLVRSGDILISTANSYEHVGKVARVGHMPVPATLGAFISLIRPKPSINPNFLYHQLAWGKTQSRIRETASTTTNISNVSTTKLAALEISVPSLSEQIEAVAEIEKQFSRLDEAVANLKRVKANLKRYKAAVLKAAVEGHLVPTQGDWKTELLGDVAISIRNGYSGKPDAENGTPILRISAVRPMALDVADVRYLSGGVDEYGTFLISSGDILFTRYNGNRDFVGVCACVPPNVAPTAYPDKLIRVRVPASTLLPEFLTISASTGVARAYLESKIRTTAGQSGISGGDLKALPLLLPSVVDQRRIVDEVERRFSLIRGVEMQTDANLKRAERMRQSVLAASFRH